MRSAGGDAGVAGAGTGAGPRGGSVAVLDCPWASARYQSGSSAKKDDMSVDLCGGGGGGAVGARGRCERGALRAVRRELCGVLTGQELARLDGRIGERRQRREVPLVRQEHQVE